MAATTPTGSTRPSATSVTTMAAATTTGSTTPSSTSVTTMAAATITGSTTPSVTTVSVATAATAGPSSSTAGTTAHPVPATSTATAVHAGIPGSAASGASASPLATTAPRLNDVGYMRWLKVGRGLLRLKVTLTKPTERVVNAFHVRIAAKVTSTGGCSCTYKNIDVNKKCMQPPCPNCDPFVGDIINVHQRKRAAKNIYWQNCVPSHWLTCSWEVAKCFMGRGQTADNTGPTETDTSNLVILWDTCDEFHPLIANRGLLHQVLTVRNKVMHSPQMACSAADMTSAFAAMVNLLSDSKLSADPDIDAAQGIKSLEELRDTPIDIITEDEIKVWHDLIKSQATKLNTVAADVDTHSKALATLTTEGGTHSKALATLTTEVGTHAKTLETVTTEVATLKKDFNQAICDFLAAHDDLLRELISHEQTKKQLSELQLRVTDQQQSTKELQLKFTEQQSDITTLYLTTDEQSERVGEQQSDITALYSTTDEQSEKVREQQRDITNLYSTTEVHERKFRQLEKQQTTKDSRKVLKELGGELKDTYLRECSRIQPIPWLDRKLPLQEVFVPMTLRRSAKDSYSQGREVERSVPMDDIFRPLQAESPPPRRVLIECTPGGGKSTLCQRLVYSWAQGVKASSPELSARTSTSHLGHHPLPTRTPPEPVGRARPRLSRATEKGGLYPSFAGFAIVLLLIVRNLVVGDLSNNLLTLLVGESWRSRQEELRTCLANNCQKVLVILDGYDEAAVPHKDILEKILGNEWMKGCTILVTSRPGFCKSPFDVRFDLEGFDHQKRVNYINRFMEVVKGVPDHPDVAVLLHRLESPGIIGDLCQTPLFLMLVCVLSGQEGNPLPDTRTELYEQFATFLRRQAVERHEFEPDCMSSLQQTLQRIAFALLKDNTSEISLATIEQHSSTLPSTPGPSTVKHDQPPTARADVILRELCQVGFLIQNYKLKGLDEVASGSFIHQSFVDYFAAKRFVTIPKDQRETFIAENTMFHNVFVYVAGLAAGRRELLVELFDGWRMAVAALGAPRFDRSDPVNEMGRMDALTRANHALLHDAPFSWLAESIDVCSASLALLTHGQLEAVCLTRVCTESCVRGVRTLCEVLSGQQASPASHPLHLGCVQLGAGVVLDVLKQVELTHGAVDCVRLDAGLSGGPWTVRECESLAALPAYTRLKVIHLVVCEWEALDALSVSFTPTHALQQLTVWCGDPPSGCGVLHSLLCCYSGRQHLTEFRRNVRCLSNIQWIALVDKAS